MSLEKAANLATIVLAFVAVALLVERRFIDSENPLGLGDNVSESRLIGQQASFVSPGKDSAVQVILILSTTCKYCIANTPFYKKLREATQAKHGRARLLAVFPQPLAEVTDFIGRYGLQAYEAQRVDFHELQRQGMSATPAILLLDGQGIVRQAWLGWLDDSRQSEVLNTILDAM